jgi:arginyl-tRNA synthetase
MTTVRSQVDSLLRKALEELAARPGLAAVASLDARIERTRDARHGDFTTPIAMQAAKALGRNPRELAAALQLIHPHFHWGASSQARHG